MAGCGFFVQTVNMSVSSILMCVAPVEAGGAGDEARTLHLILPDQEFSGNTSFLSFFVTGN